MYEADLPTEQEKATDDLRLPQENEDGQRACGHQSQTPHRPQKTLRLKRARIRARAHYQAIQKTGKRFFGKAVLFNYRWGKGPHTLLGITVSRRYGKAHERCRFKRLVREIFRHSVLSSQGLEMNIIPLVRPKETSFRTIRDDFAAFFRSLPGEGIEQ